MTILHKILWCVAAVVLVFVGYAWLQEHDARLTLVEQQKANSDALAVIQTNEQARVATLKTALAQLGTLKKTVVSPQQIIKALPQVTDLPAPIREVAPSQITDTSGLHSGDLVIPAIDAKPWFDAQVACKQCAVSLA